MNQALWLGHSKGITRFAVDGTKVATIIDKEDVEVIGVAPFALVPTLDILAPTADQVTNDPMPILKVKVSALCNADPCAFSVGYFDSYHLSARLDGLDIGNLFTRVPGSAESTQRPATRLPDGAHIFSAQATDSFGQVSMPRETKFIIDTTPPKFSAVSPADGSLFKTPGLTLTGSVDESSAIRLDGPGTSLSANGLSFSFPIVLNEGVNHFVLHATDAAGNPSDKPLGYTLDSIAPKFTAIAPADGTASSTANVTLTGAVDESATIQLSGDGIAQTAEGTGFSFPLVLKAGVNSYSLTATDKAGNQATATVRLTLQNVALKFATLSPADGTFFASAKTTITGSLAEPANFKLTGEGLTLSARGDKFSFPVTLKTGINTFHVTATNAAGNSAQADLNLTLAPVTITVTSPLDVTSTTDESVTVAGTIGGPPGTTVSINDVSATLTDGAFSVSVPLALGPNVINLMAISPARDGLAQSTIIIQRQSADPLAVIVFDTPMDGAVFVAPATILVKAQAKRPDGSNLSGLKISNDSPVGFQNGVGESGYAEYAWTNVPEGTYEIIASVTDENGTVIAKSVTVKVEADPADQPFVDAWKQMTDALKNGDKTTALSFFTGSAAEIYGEVIDALLPQMPAIVASFSKLRHVEVSGGMGEFAINRTINGIDQIFFVTFIQAENGVWKIDSM